MAELTDNLCNWYSKNSLHSNRMLIPKGNIRSKKRWIMLYPHYLRRSYACGPMRRLYDARAINVQYRSWNSLSIRNKPFSRTSHIQHEQYGLTWKTRQQSLFLLFHIIHLSSVSQRAHQHIRFKRYNLYLRRLNINLLPFVSDSLDKQRCSNSLCQRYQNCLQITAAQDKIIRKDETCLHQLRFYNPRLPICSLRNSRSLVFLYQHNVHT